MDGPAAAPILTLPDQNQMEINNQQDHNPTNLDVPDNHGYSDQDLDALNSLEEEANILFPSGSVYMNPEPSLGMY